MESTDHSIAVATFNSFFYEFVKVAKGITKTHNKDVYEIIRKNYTVKDSSTKDHMMNFVEELTPSLLDDILNIDVSVPVLSEGMKKMQIIKGVDMSVLLSAADSDDMNGIFSYIFIMCVLQIGYVNELTEDSMNKLVNTLSECQTCNGCSDGISFDDILDENITNLLEKIAKLSTSQETKGAGSTFEEKLSNSTIGSLAKEIAEDMDISKMNINSPDDIFSADNSQVIGDIVGKVTSKLHSKMQNGTINQEQMMSEAMSLFSTMGGLGGLSGMMGGAAGGGEGSGFNPDMLNNMMKTMSKSFGGHSGSAARSRLSRKYADRKKC
jgi:hypothetical protein